MSPEVNAEEHLVGHYSALGDLKSDFRNRNLYNLVAGLVKGNKVVDIGCGVGELLSILKARGKLVAGVEPARGMRELAQKINPDIPVSANLNLNEKVDSVVMLDVLEHIEDDTEQVRKINSVLNSGGEFIFVVPAHQILYGQRDKQMGHYRRYSKKMLKNLLVRNGFEIISMRYWNALGFLPYFISEKILRKALNLKSRHKASLMQRLLNLWVERIENHFDFGFGLSIIGVAKKHEVL